MRSPMPRAALLLFAALTFAAPVAAADVFTRLDSVAARAITRTRVASPDAAGLLDAAEPTATLMSVDEGAMAAFRAAGGGRLAIPAEDGATVELELEPYTLLAKGVSVTYTDDLGRHDFTDLHRFAPLLRSVKVRAFLLSMALGMKLFFSFLRRKQ